MRVTQHDEDIKYKCTALLVTLLDHDTMLRIDFFNESIAHVINTIKDKDNGISNIRCESQLMYIHDMWNSSVNFQSKWIRYLKSNHEAATNIKNLLMAILNQPDKNSGIIKLVLTLKVEMFEWNLKNCIAYIRAYFWQDGVEVQVDVCVVPWKNKLNK